MSTKPPVNALALVLAITLVAPAAFFVAPQRASAAGVNCIGGIIGGIAGSAVSTIVAVPVSDAVDQNVNSIGGGASVGSCINDVILIPLARAAIRAMLQKMTASVISWINNTPGKNGTGSPSYVRNLSVNLRGIGDAVALPFIARIATGFNSPFGSAISASLYTHYSQQTSMAGFFAANQNTLARISPNVNAYLAGNWTQGGVGAWFALTTQTQNNPYTLYQAALGQIGNSVSLAQVNRRQDLVQSGGFLSWCGTTDASAQVQSSATAAYQQCMKSGGTGNECQAVYNEGGGTSLAEAGSGGVNPGDSCVNRDGTPGNILTPGSVIHGYTQQAVVNSGFQQLISATDLDNALGAIIGALLNQVLGGVNGLFGGSSGSASAPAATTQLQSYSSSSVAATDTAFQTAQTILTRIAIYTSAWQTIATAANTASTSVKSLASFCTAAAVAAGADSTLTAFVTAANAQAAAAQAVLTTKIAPVLTQALAAPSTAASTQTFALQVQTKASGATMDASLASDVSTLMTMPPSVSDTTAAQTNASATGGAFADPAGSLTVSGGSLVDQMSLLSTNATALKGTVCTPSSAVSAGDGGTAI